MITRDLRLRRGRPHLLVSVFALLSAFSASPRFNSSARADWPTLRGDAQRTGYSSSPLKFPLHIAWIRHFENERLGTAMEPILAAGKLFVSTHNGSVYALDASTGDPLWRFNTTTPFLHSPAYADGLVIAADADRTLFALDATTGKPRWTLAATRGGFAASPCAAGGSIFIGSRAGEFYAVDLRTGKPIWHVPLDAPIRQSAAHADGRVYVTAEDMRTRCLDAATGKPIWTSQPLPGQSARDYYPVIAKTAGRTAVIVRTSPVLHMPERLTRDLRMLCQNAGVESGDWKKIDTWTKSDAAMGNADLWAKEQTAIGAYLDKNPDAQTFFALDAATGRPLATAPVLWLAGCQGVPAPPVVMPDGKLFTEYRTAYGNWTEGVAAFVGLGTLDLSTNRITPVHHVHGHKPPWNTFWGTADESLNFVLAGDTLLIVHQSTLSAFDLKTRQLTAIAGERDGWAGMRNLPWARNEWNGPARGGVAIDGGRLYWLSGSRILCLAPGPKPNKPAQEIAINGTNLPQTTIFTPPPVTRTELLAALESAVREFVSTRWAPLYVQPGIGGREFFFTHSRDTFEALCRARPHVSEALRAQVDQFLAKEWIAFSPYAVGGQYSLKDGKRREYFAVPPEYLTTSEKSPHPFAGVYATTIYLASGGQERVVEAWPRIRATFADFAASEWSLDPAKGDLEANRYDIALHSLAAISAIDGKGSPDGNEAALKAKAADAALVQWWQRAAATSPPVFADVAELDRFIGNGDALFFRVFPHRAKLALFRGLTKAVADHVRAKAPDAVEKVWHNFESQSATWWLAGEERQVHYGENLFDPPDFSLDAFRAYAWSHRAPLAELRRRVDLPVCHADLGYIIKLSIALTEN